MDKLKKLSGTVDGCGTAWVVRYVDAVKLEGLELRSPKDDS